MTQTEKELLDVCGKMAARLKTWKRMREQAEECGRNKVELHPAELFEPSDAEALEAWEIYLKHRAGEQPLFNDLELKSL